jgi:hypothetical protein
VCFARLNTCLVMLVWDQNDNKLHLYSHISVFGTQELIFVQFSWLIRLRPYYDGYFHLKKNHSNYPWWLTGHFTRSMRNWAGLPELKEKALGRVWFAQFFSLNLSTLGFEPNYMWTEQHIAILTKTRDIPTDKQDPV